MIAHTSPARFRRQAVNVRYSLGFSRYVLIMKSRYSLYTEGVLLRFRLLKNSGRDRRSIAWIVDGSNHVE